MSFRCLSTSFHDCHRHPLNVALHLVTTPLGIFAGLLLLARLHPLAPPLVVAAYLVSLRKSLPTRLWARTALCLAPLSYLPGLIDVGPFAPVGLLCAAYFGQDLAHFLTGEATFQRSYARSPTRFSRLLEHTYFLLPLCLDAARRADVVDAVLTWFTPHTGLARARLVSPGDLADLQTLRSWALQRSPAPDTTTHWWYTALDPEARAAFARIVGADEIAAMLRARHDEAVFAVEPLGRMNELYVASLSHTDNSDAVFYADHVDGPFMVWPFATVYRCIVAVNDNTVIRTCFPMTPSAETWTTGDVGGFDFNREVHRIEHNPGTRNTEPRITLKLHYLVYPRAVPRYGRLLGALTTAWDIAARRAFLKSLRPASLVERALARVIIRVTAAYRLLARHVGGGNIAYLLLLLILDRLLDAPIFLVGSSFVHYLLYIATYYSRGDVAFYTFKRDAMLYKGLALAQLVLLGLRDFQPEPLALVLIVAGAGLSTAAARAIGIDRTYFAAELGRCERRRIDRFPYNVMPHPMIAGNVIALIGVAQLPGLEAAPYLVPTHIGLYLVHLAQEHVDWHRR